MRLYKLAHFYATACFGAASPLTSTNRYSWLRGSVTQTSEEEQYCGLGASKVQSWGTGWCLWTRLANRTWKAVAGGAERERHRLARTDKEGVWELQAGGGCCFYDIFFKGFCFFVLRFLYFFDPTQNLFFPLLMMLYVIYLFMPFSPYARRILTYFKRGGVFVYTCLYTYEQVPVTPG